MKQRYESSWSRFLAMVCPNRGQCSQANHQREYLLHLTGIEPNAYFETPTFSINLAVCDPLSIAFDERDKVALLLYGEIHDTSGEGNSTYLLRQYTKKGQDCFKDLNGSFVILLMDKENDEVAVITDRLNTRKVFYSKFEGGFLLSNSLHLHPTEHAALDPTAIACYLVNGVVHNNRTVFEGIRVLDRACIHKLGRDGFDSDRYWSYEHNKEYARVEEKELRVELSRLLIEGVRKRLDDDAKIFLSLSGGHESSAVLGILGLKLGIPEVTCFSYISGNPVEGSDAYVARKMADLVGYEHRVLQSYGGDPLETIKCNADMGQGLAFFCDETYAWLRFYDMVSHLDRTCALFVGDTSLDWASIELHSYRDALKAAMIYDFTALSWLSDYLDRDTYVRLRDGWHEDLAEIAERCPTMDDLYDAEAYFYLDQRLNNVILTWREFFCSRFMSVRYPLLDNDVLDFLINIPISMLREKRLYKQTVHEMFPGIFHIERATTGGYVPDWEREFTVFRDGIESLVRGHDSQLDGLIPPQLATRLLSDICGENGRAKPTMLSLQAMLLKLAGCLPRSIRSSSVANRLRPKRDYVSQIDLLKRILVLRLFLGKSNDRDILNVR